MSESGVTRRDFMRIVGLAGSGVALVGCGNTSIESGAELVESYVQPENFVVPGVGVYYASTCTQCPSACGIMGRVREGRILKLEGNPGSAISNGKICGLGQAAVQGHWSPDRLKTPMVRKGGTLQPASWDEAMALLGSGTAGGHAGRRVWLTGPVSGHHSVLLQNLVSTGLATDHLTYDALSNAVTAGVHRHLYGEGDLVTLIDQAGIVLSFGNDFLGAGDSPVMAARQYARLRKAKRRGVLVQVEPRMTLTGANADRWVVIAPGTEGVLALGLVRELAGRKEYGANLPPALLAAVEHYDPAMVSRITGVPGDLVPHLAATLWEHAPSLVLAGRYPQGHAHGSANVAAIELLNVVLQNNGRTLMRGAEQPFPQLAPVQGSTAALAELTKSMADGKVAALVVNGTNPVFSAPDFLGFQAALQKVPFKAAWVTELDETAMECDLVLPLASPLEDFGTHVAANQSDGLELSIQQPLMEKLYPETRPFGDVVLDLLRQAHPDSYKAFPDYFAFLKSAVVNAKSAFQGQGTDEEFWENTLSAGVLHRAAPLRPLPVHELSADMIAQPAPAAADPKFPFALVPAIGANLRDGRPASLPWLQESPDPLTTIAWESWVELHPSTAKALQIEEGDVLRVTSAHGTLEAKAYLFPGIHPGAIGVPVGQGHESYGRYASHKGVNPLRILDPVFDQASGEFALYATRVAVAKVGRRTALIKDEGATSVQQGRKLVATVSADQVDLSKEPMNVLR